MKKTLAVISMTSFVFNSFATTLDFRNIIIQNQSVQEQFRLETETTRTEYRQEPVTRTCYRQEIVGYRRVCEDSFDFLSLNAASTIKRERDEEPGHPRRPPPDRPEPGHPPREPRPEPTREPRPEPTREPRPEPTREPRPEPTREPRPEPTREPWPEPGHPPRPRPEPTREPWPEPGHPPRPRPEPTREPRPEPRPPICHDEPIYRTVEYSCTQMETVPYEVLDHRTHANVQIKMSKAPIQLPQTESCGVNFKLYGDQFNIENQCRNYMLYGTHIISGTTEEQSHQLNLALKEFDRTIRPFLGELANAYIEDGYLKFRVGDFRKAGDFKFRLLIVKQRKTLRDHVLINRELHLNEIEFEENSSNPNVGWARINLDRLIGPMNPNRRYLIKLNLDSLLDEKLIINRNQFPKLHQETSLFR